MLVKLSPVFFGEQDRFISVLDICEEFGVNGYVISNTMPFTHPKFGKGGRSGAAVIHSAKILTVVARKHLKHRQIHGVGGVFTANDMYTYECAGANFVQVYNGFVHGPLAGTDFVPRLLTGFLAIKKRMSEDKNTLSPAQKRINAMLDGDAT